MTDRKQVGSAGEQAAADYLRKRGYAILDCNFKIKYPNGPWRGEVDIIAKKKGIIHFVEVKSGLIEFTNNAFPPESRVGTEKRRRLIKTAQLWLAKHKIPQASKWQIDIVAVYGNNPYGIRVFENITF